MKTGREPIRLQMATVGLTALMVVSGCAGPDRSAASKAAAPEKAGVVSGRVVLVGTPPARRDIGATVRADPHCGRLTPEGPILARSYVVDTSGGLADVLVRVVEAPVVPPTSVVGMEMKCCRMEPYVVGVQTGQTLEIRNTDPILDNLMIQGRANPGANVVVSHAGQVITRVFPQAEVEPLRVTTNVRPWMIGYVHVIPNGFFAVTDEQGGFVLPAGLPPGRYTLEAVHRLAGVVRQEIEVGAGRIAPVELTLAVGAGPG